MKLYESRIKDLNIKAPDKSVMERAAKNWDNIAKPLGGLGSLEDMVVRMAGMLSDADVHIDKRCVLIACADNGVVEEGVAQSDSQVTASVAREIALGRSNINAMGKAAKADVYAIDMGMKQTVECKGIINRKITAGTRNIAKEAAMSTEQAAQAVMTGVELVGEMKEKGYNIIVTGEMGIGNTTTASALASVLLQKDACEVTGRGAGLTAAGLNRKIEVIRHAIEINQATVNDEPLILLSKLGGYDICAMTGMFIGGAVHGLPILIDGMVSSVAALIAYRLVPGCREYMLASHVTKEPAAEKILKLLGLKPVIHAGMYVGEGTGAVCMLALLDIALAEYHYAHRFDQTDIEKYEKKY